MIEAVEDVLHLAEGDADARIGYGEAELAVAIGRDGEFDFAAGGEFNGVEEEIEKDLADAVGVGDEEGRDGRMDGRVDGDAGGNGGCEEANEFVEERLGGKWRGLDADMTGLGAGEFEDVVDDAQEPLGGVTDGFSELALPGIERGLEEELGHADDGVHGSPKFVTHVGDESFFCFGGGGELLVPGFELDVERKKIPLRFAALLNVNGDAADGEH